MTLEIDDTFEHARWLPLPERRTQKEKQRSPRQHKIPLKRGWKRLTARAWNALSLEGSGWMLILKAQDPHASCWGAAEANYPGQHGLITRRLSRRRDYPWHQERWQHDPRIIEDSPGHRTRDSQQIGQVSVCSSWHCLDACASITVICRNNPRVARRQLRQSISAPASEPQDDWPARRRLKPCRTHRPEMSPSLPVSEQADGRLQRTQWFVLEDLMGDLEHPNELAATSMLAATIRPSGSQALSRSRRGPRGEGVAVTRLKHFRRVQYCFKD
ncbi:hypothetical protein BDZ85DRAFT_249784 [Elsinoe ampelina]|uniref:Uncharacterized protein n=1 Tax=Elsinoe ampelina TaxID=302913 RepID=A0A6A6GB59_9PEZI|nr:hypothetical protein BDZ85DRAFT_249784 [Elsinoe ampelina]